MTQETKWLGEAGEREALTNYLDRGYKIVEKNWRTKLGEIDLILRKKDLLAFVEVKSSSLHSDYHPLENITEEKIKRLNSLINFYLSLHHKTLSKIKKIRLDAALVWETHEGYRVEIIEHIFN